MAHSSLVHCGRCAHEVVPVRVWSGFAWVKRAWYTGVLLIVALMPIILSEITLLLPLAMVFALAAGPVHALAAQRDTCSECGAELTKNARRPP